MARILKTLEAVTAGHGRLVLLSGEPGIGKTRSCPEVLGRAGEVGARACIGRSFEQHTAVPFFPFTEALTLPPVGEPLLPQAGALERWPQLARLLPDSGADQQKDAGHETQLQVFRAATAFLRAVADASPLVLLLDDLHRADATSVSLLLYLGRHPAGARVLMLGTYRDVDVDRQHPLANAVRELVRERLADEMTLRRLAVNETAELVRMQLGGGAVSDELVTLVQRLAEGNPFFIEELVKDLIERGVVFRVDGRWDSRTQDAVEVPRSVRSVVGQRVSRLLPDVQELLRLASVVGQEFELEVVLRASGRPESVVMNELDAALGAGLLEERRGDMERYRFAHALIQQTLYEELPSHRRKRLHRRVGESLESLGIVRPSVAAHLVRHFMAAGDSDHTLRYAIDAGDQAAARSAHAEAVRHYEVAIDRLSEAGDARRAADLQYRLARELRDLNRLADALTAYAAALGTFERVGDTAGQARVHRGIGLLQLGSYDVAAGVHHVDAALQLWPPEREDAELAWLLVDASRVKYFFGDCTAALALAERCLTIAEESGNPGLLARALTRAAFSRTRQDPRPSTALGLLDRAERVAHSSGEWRALSQAPKSDCIQTAASSRWVGSCRAAPKPSTITTDAFADTSI
jgi:predicted ATPase